MSKKTGFVIAGLLLAAALAAVLVMIIDMDAQAPSVSSDAAQSDSRNSQEPQVDTTPDSEVRIVFDGDEFLPRTVRVSRGTKITVVNTSSNQRVQFSSDNHPSHTKNPEMNLRTLGPSEQASYVATQVGEWGYHDHIDDELTGKVIVSEQ